MSKILIFYCVQNLGIGYGHPKDIQRAESRGFDRHGAIEESWDRLRETPGSSGYRQVARGKGGRPRGKSQKGVTNSATQSGKRSTKQGETLTQFLLQQGMNTPGQKHKRGRRTVRRRRPEKKVVEESKVDDFYEKDTFMNTVEEPENSGREEEDEDVHNFSSRNIVGENDDSSNSDDNVDDGSFQYSKWGATAYDGISNRNVGMVEMSEEEEEADDIDDARGYDDENGENLGGDIGYIDEDSDRDEQGNQGDDGSDSLVSGDYSDD